MAVLTPTLGTEVAVLKSERFSGGDVMCDHHGGYAGTGSVPGSIDRRAFLRGSAADAVVISVLGGAPAAGGCILGRVESIIEMGYIKNKPGRDAIDWTFLEQAIKEVPEVYSQLKYKAA